MRVHSMVLADSGIKVVAGKIAASDFGKASEVLAAVMGTISLLQAIEDKGFKFYLAPWTNNTGNVYNAYLIAKDPSEWESHKPSEFSNAYVMGQEFIGDEQEFISKDTSSVDLKKVGGALKRGKYFKGVNPSVSLVGDLIVVSFRVKEKSFRVGLAPNDQCGVLDEHNDFLERAVPEVPDSLILEFYMAVKDCQDEDKQFLGKPFKVSLEDFLTSLSGGRAQAEEIDKRLQDILDGKAGFWSNVRFD